jgi:DNA-binding CsgD family transcriptional regulator
MSGIEARVLALVGEVSGLLDLDEFRDRLLSALRAEIACDYISLNQIAPDPELNWSVTQPPLPVELHQTFYRLALQNPLAERHLRTRDGRPLRFSDVVTPAQLRATDLYRELYRAIRVEHQIAFTLPSPSQRILAIALSRCERDFSDTERDLLALARPHLIQIYRNVLTFTDLARSVGRGPAMGPGEDVLVALGLTVAQARVLRRISIGRSGADIARELQIAQRTVDKHLQRIYGKLGVDSRFAAAEIAWRAAVAATASPPAL